MKKKLVAVLLTACLAMVVVAGCGSSSSRRTTSSKTSTKNDSKTFVIGVDDTFPPMGFRNKKNKIVGFDIDLAREAAKRMNMKFKVQAINWDTKEMELNKGNIDAIWNGLSITEERKKKMDFTTPYLQNDQVIVVKKDSSIASKDDLAGKTVGCQKGSSAEDALEADPIYKKIKGGKPTEFDENVSCFQDLDAGRIDAMVVDSVVAKYYIAKHHSNFKIVGESLQPEQYGVAVKKGNTKMLNKIQKALDDMKADGTAGKISKKWFGEDIIYNK
jgi:polar amino acid transport system substrate-binding protein